MMVMTMNLDQEPIPLDSRLWIFFSVFINNVFCHALDVYVINGYHRLGEGGGGEAITLNQRAR